MSDSESDERRDSFYDGDEDISYDDIGSERLSEIYDRNSESTEHSMGPVSQEMKLSKEITGLRQEIGYKNEMIDLLKIHNEACKKEKYELTSKIERLEKENEKYILLLEELSSSQRKRNGGNNKRIKYVSKRSTASHNHATRRHSSKR
jgi:hypothetical protein